ncbi:MAG: hypothetical protein ACKVVP_10775 [Chloroflexota bacterium]
MTDESERNRAKQSATDHPESVPSPSESSTTHMRVPDLGSQPETILTRCPNPSCEEWIEPGLQFCQACGTDLAPGASPPAENAAEPVKLWFWLFTILWIALAIGAFIFLYTQAFFARA